MAGKTSKLINNRIVSASIMAVLTLLLLAGVQALVTGSGPKDPTTPIAISPTDSSNCIACHTDAAVIESMAVIVDDGGHGGEGG